MKSRKALTLSALIILAIISTLPSAIHKTAAPTVWQVDLDANNTSQTDTLVQSSFTTAKTFRVGAVVNATTTNPIQNVAGWQFQVNYDPSQIVPQADPTPASTTDYADTTAKFGAQTTGCSPIGGCNFAAKLAANQAFSTFALPNPGQVLIGYTSAPIVPITISAKTILGSVAFEVIAKPTSAIMLTISNVLFVDPNGVPIANVIAGNGASETITNDPPHASFSVTKVSTYVYTFTSASTDSDGTIANPAGYFWDFGDGTYDLGTGGSFLAHNYSSTCATGCPNGASLPGNFDVTLRVVDDMGATGSARDSSDAVIMNTQPSHASQTFLIDAPPTAAFTFSPSNPAPANAVSFNASTSSDSDGIVSSYAWDFNDSTTGTGVAISHVFATARTYHVKLNVTDDAGLHSTKIIDVPVAIPVHQPPTVTVTPSTGAIYSGTTTTIQLSASASSGTITKVQVNWGDGTQVDNITPTSTSATHTYANAGNYNITVTVTDDTGATTVKQATVSVASSPPPPGLPGGILTIIAIPLVAIVAIAILLLRRRGKPSQVKVATA